jgi:hypothetical protein
MDRSKLPQRTGLFVLAVLLALAAGVGYAQVGGGFDLSWNTIDGGGSTSPSTGGSYSLSGSIGQPDAGSMAGGSYTVQGGFWYTPSVALLGHVTWEGRPAQPHALQQLPITITLKMGSSETDYPLQTTDSSGYFTINPGNLPIGTYSWRVKGPHGTPDTNTTPGFLANSGTLVLTGTSGSTIEMGLMRAGDANNDNVVDVLDFNLLKNSFGLPQGAPGYEPRADFNGDAVIDILDFNLIKGNFGQPGAPPLGPTR